MNDQRRAVELRLKSTTRRDRDALLAELQALFGDRLRVTFVSDDAQPVGGGRAWLAYAQCVLGDARSDFTDADFVGLED